MCVRGAASLPWQLPQDLAIASLPSSSKAVLASGCQAFLDTDKKLGPLKGHCPCRESSLPPTAIDSRASSSRALFVSGCQSLPPETIYSLFTKGILWFLGVFTGCNFWLVGVFPGYKGYSPASKGVQRLEGVFYGCKEGFPFLSGAGCSFITVRST